MVAIGSNYNIPKPPMQGRFYEQLHREVIKIEFLEKRPNGLYNICIEKNEYGTWDWREICRGMCEDHYWHEISPDNIDRILKQYFNTQPKREPVSR